MVWVLTDLQQVECPTGSGDYLHLAQVAEEIQHRNIHIFGKDTDGRRACHANNNKLDFDPHFRDYLNFHEVSNSSTTMCTNAIC